MAKIKITSSQFYDKVYKEYDSTPVEVNISDLELILKAAKKCIRFAIMSDNFLGGGLTVEDEEMAKAYKTVSKEVSSQRNINMKKAEDAIDKIFEVVEDY